MEEGAKDIKVQLIFEQHGFNCTGPLIHRFFMAKYDKCLFSYNFLNIFFSRLVYCKNTDIIHITYNICVN